jgi:hypothetical protein
MDDVCPITATRYSVKDLNLTVTKPWRPWYTPANEVMHELSFEEEYAIGLFICAEL